MQSEYAKHGIEKNEEEIFEMLSRLISTVELFPYHSVVMDKSLINKCESCKLLKEYVHNELIPNSRLNGQLICFTRAIKEWELTPEEKKMDSICYNNEVGDCRNVRFGINSKMGRKIYEHISSLTKDFTEII